MIIKVQVKEGKGEPHLIDGILFVHTTARRENNAANLDIIRQLSRYFGIEQSDIKLIRGRTNRKKTFSISKLK